MNCDCMGHINKILEPKGEQLSTLFTVGKEAKTFCVVKTEKIMLGRGKCSNIIPNFCPFCGTRVDK